MTPIVHVYLTDLGPNKKEVLPVVARLLGVNYLGVARKVAAGPVFLTGGDDEVLRLYRWLLKHGATVELRTGT